MSKRLDELLGEAAKQVKEGGAKGERQKKPYRANNSVGVIQGKAINSRVTQTINLGHEKPPARFAEPQTGRPSGIKRFFLKLADLF